MGVEATGRTPASYGKAFRVSLHPHLGSVAHTLTFNAEKVRIISFLSQRISALTRAVQIKFLNILLAQFHLDQQGLLYLNEDPLVTLNRVLKATFYQVLASFTRRFPWIPLSGFQSKSASTLAKKNLPPFPAIIFYRLFSCSRDISVHKGG